MKTIINILLLPSLVATAAFAQDGTLPPDSHFYNPTIGPAEVVLKAISGNSDDSPRFNQAIESLNRKGGGVLMIEGGAYRLDEVKLLSNVHLRVKPGVILKPSAGAKGLFTASGSGATGNDPVTNFSLTGEDGRFTVDFSQESPGEGMRAISLFNVKNFKLANFNVLDNDTKFSSITLGAALSGKSTVLGFPQMGIVENIGVTKAHTGYGLVQDQAGSNILFRNLTGIGGVTLRLETGLSSLQLLKEAAPRLDGIYGRNIACTNGQAAVTLSPHTIKQGIVDVRGITANSCEVAVVIASGFVSSKESRGQSDPALGLTPGSFDSRSVIADVTANFGQNAQLRKARIKFLPCELRTPRKDGAGLSQTEDKDDVSYHGPSIGSVGYFGEQNDAYKLNVREDTVVVRGFSTQMPKNAIIREGLNDIKCP
jgi:hypothetical protein